MIFGAGKKTLFVVMKESFCCYLIGKKQGTDLLLVNQNE